MYNMIFKKTIFLSFLFFPVFVSADSVILMIGDGMGQNHLKCAEETQKLFIPTLPVQGTIHTRSANNAITDSAASATAYACGIKTNNNFLAKSPDRKDCLTIAEEATQKGLSVGIYSTDHTTGATPSAFYAHTSDRNNKAKITRYKKEASKLMDIVVPVQKISEIVSDKLEKANRTGKDFFVLFEGHKIDSYSHKNKLEEMKQELYDFDLAVKKAAHFINNNPDITLIVLADHETGGLTSDCKYTSDWHTGSDVFVYASGQHAPLFKGPQDNTQIHHKIHKILFNSDIKDK